MTLHKDPGKQVGATLLEMLGYLTLAGVVIGGTAILLTGGFASATSNSLSVELQAIRTSVLRLRNTGGDFGAGSLNAAIANANGLPRTLKVDSATAAITNQWGGAVVITGAGSVFTINYSAVPQSVCAQGLSMIGGAEWSALSINGTAIATPLTPAAIGAGCNASSNAFVITGA